MQIASSSGVDYSALLKQLNASIGPSPTAFAGQNQTGVGSSAANGAGSTSATPFAPPADSGSSRFNSDTLAQLVSFQIAPAAPTSSTESGSTATSDEVRQALEALQKSLSGLETSLGTSAGALTAAGTTTRTTTTAATSAATATSAASASAAAAAALGQVFASLDTDNDGQLSQAELTASLQKLDASARASTAASSQTQDAQATQAEPPHHHHHHHAAYAAAADATASTSASTSAPTATAGATVNLAA